MKMKIKIEISLAEIDAINWVNSRVKKRKWELKEDRDDIKRVDAISARWEKEAAKWRKERDKAMKTKGGKK